MKRLITHNFGLKLLSLGFAVLLWFIISARGTSEVTFEVPIEYLNIPEGYEILHKEYDSVSVSVFGSEQILRAVKPSDIRVVIDLKGGEKGKKTYNILKKNIKVPPAVSVSNVSPSAVEVTLDRRTTRTVPVQPKIKGLDKKRYKLTFTPPVIKIEGPESIIKRIRKLTTEEINLKQLLSEKKMEVPVNRDFEKVRLSTDLIEVEVTEILPEEGK